MIKKTLHGDNIADQIQDYDAYGRFNIMNESDLYNIIDQFQTHIMEKVPEDDKLVKIIAAWMDQLAEEYDIDLP